MNGYSNRGLNRNRLALKIALMAKMMAILIAVVIAAIVVAGAACAGETGGKGVIEGTVLLGPNCPVQRQPPDPQCADRPYAAALEAEAADGSGTVVELQSDDQGKFSAKLPPGKYDIRSASSANPFPRCSSAGPFIVEADSVTVVAVSCDTGIR